jgi:MoxR-like ATPase
MKLIAPYPALEEEKRMVSQVLSGEVGAKLVVSPVSTVLDTQTFITIRNMTAHIRVDEVIIDYAVRLVAATRHASTLEAGAGPRGSLALIRCARALALLEARDFVLPDDVKALALPVLAHRLTLSAESELEGLSAEHVIEDLLSKTETPRA